MSEKDLNIEYICEKTLLNKDDELVPIILSLIQESYKAGLCQTEFDNTMNLIEENQELKKQVEENKQLKDNWNELKKWLRIKDILANSKINPQSIKFKDLLKHMEYLEKER